jgi:tetratricopeptide (TPR) repeat protein
MTKVVRTFLILGCFLLLATKVHSQEEIDQRYKSADTNNAIIQGKVVLPSGFAAETYFKITLRNHQSMLGTYYTNKHGEFQIRNLSEGTYFVQAEQTDGNFEPAVRRVELGRGLMMDLTLEVKEKRSAAKAHPTTRVISAAELAQAIPAPAKKEYDLGVKLSSKGEFLQAAEHFERAVALYPEYLAARNDLGAQYLKLKRLDEAQKHFETVIAKDPKNFNAKFNMGLVTIERRDYRNAIAQLNEAIAIDSSRPVARLWIGFAELELGDVQLAETELTKALVMGGEECVSAHYHLARVYMTRGDVAEASRSLQVYLDQAPRGEYAKEAKELARQIEKRK